MDSYTRAAIDCPRGHKPAPLPLRVAGLAILWGVTCYHVAVEIPATLAAIVAGFLA